MWRLQALLQPSHDIAGSTAWNNAVYNASAAVRDDTEYQAPEPATYIRSRERKNAPRNVSGKELRPCAEPFEEWTSQHVHDWLSTSVKLPEVAKSSGYVLHSSIWLTPDPGPNISGCPQEIGARALSCSSLENSV